VGSAQGLIGFVGIGMMGAPMCRHVLEGGFGVMVYDLSDAAIASAREAGARPASNLAELAQRCEIILITVPTDDDVRNACFGEHGIIESARAGTVVVICSSVMPATCVEIGEHGAAHGVEVLDAPLTGGPRRAENATLTLLVGGNESAFKAAEPALRTFSSSIDHMGVLGNGQVTKTVNNLIHWGEIVVITEALALGATLGLDVAELRDALTRASVDSRTLRELELMKFTWPEKDLANAIEMAAGVGVELEVAGFAREKMRDISPGRVAKLFSEGQW
jgi:3-hydroxyisobutyrate dehydrogenase-like beta-hydroxyacid dehydrogenase